MLCRVLSSVAARERHKLCNRNDATIFYKQITYDQAADALPDGLHDDDEDAFISTQDLQTRFVLRVSHVFHVDQVIGYTPPLPLPTPLDGAECVPMPAIDTFVGNTGAEIRHEGEPRMLLAGKRLRPNAAAKAVHRLANIVGNSGL